MAAERRVFLSTLPAGRAQRRLALAVVAASTLVFIACAPFAQLQLAPVPAFIPAYQSALVVCDLITAVLLFGQFAILRSTGLLVLSAAYLFTGLIAVVHGLSFPGLFPSGGLPGAGPQTTAWLYMFWHAGFPLLIIAYALMRDGAREAVSPAAAGLWTGLAVLATVAALTLAATAGQSALPAIMQGNRYTPAMILVVTSVWVLSLLALGMLWRLRPHTVIDLWLMVVLCAWLFDIALAAVLNGGRFDLGFYAGRLYGLAAASFVLVVLLIENAMLYARLAKAHTRVRRGRRLIEQKTNELVAANRELEAFSYSVSHDLRAPLRAVDGYARMLEEDYADRLDDEARRLLEVVHSSVKRMSDLIDDLLRLSRLARQPLATQPVDVGGLVRETLEELRPQYAGRAVEFRVGDLGTALGDTSLLRQVLANLLGNAVKYSRGRESAVIEVGRLGDASEAVFFVKDNGAGFDMRHVGKLFGVFQRLHRAEEYEGNGVGLAIVQRVIARHGGRVWAESRPDEGSTFYFTLQPVTAEMLPELRTAA